MKDKLIKYWERKERYLKNAFFKEDKMVLFSQAYGGLEFALEMLDNWDEEYELIELWNNEWEERLEELIYDV